MEFNFMKVKYGHKISRNDLCPCGSGKKYKNCCLENDKLEHDKVKEKARESLNKVLSEEIAKTEAKKVSTKKKTTKKKDDGWQYTATDEITINLKKGESK